jgi:hypothetical protein
VGTITPIRRSATLEIPRQLLQQANRRVKPNVSALERAFQLAKSGQVLNVADIRTTLKREGYDAQADLVGRSLKSQLKDLIRAARLDSSGPPKR